MAKVEVPKPDSKYEIDYRTLRIMIEVIGKASSSSDRELAEFVKVHSQMFLSTLRECGLPKRILGNFLNCVEL